MADWDTRRDARTPITVQVRIQVNSAMRETVQLAKEAIEAQVVDISIVGIGLTSRVFLPKGVLVDLQLPRNVFSSPNMPPPPMGTSPTEGSMPITGQVVYARPQEKLCRMGIAITKISDGDRLLLQHYVSSQERRRAPRTPLE